MAFSTCGSFHGHRSPKRRHFQRHGAWASEDLGVKSSALIGFWVLGLGLRVWGSGCKVCRVDYIWGSGFQRGLRVLRLGEGFRYSRASIGASKRCCRARGSGFESRFAAIRRKTCAWIRTCIYICIYICMYVCMYMCIYTYLVIHLYVCVCIHVHMCTCMHTCLFICEHIRCIR